MRCNDKTNLNKLQNHLKAFKLRGITHYKGHFNYDYVDKLYIILCMLWLNYATTNFINWMYCNKWNGTKYRNNFSFSTEPWSCSLLNWVFFFQSARSYD